MMTHRHPKFAGSKSSARLPVRASRLKLILSIPVLALSTLAVSTLAFAKPPEPIHRIPLEPFGFQAVSARYLLEGATMLTVDYIDNQHLLVTFGISKLMPRLPDCPVEDQDRTVRAVLLELPTRELPFGRELAHTEWRFHDLGQYLWDLGGGHFLLRQRDVLTTLTPLQSLATGDAFRQQPFLQFERRIETIVVSATHDLLSIESVRRPPAADPVAPDPPTPQAQPASTSAPGLRRRDPSQPPPDPAPVEIALIRITQQDAASGVEGDDADASIAGDRIPAAGNAGTTRLLATLEGRVRTAKLVKLPLTSDGILEIKAESRDGVLLNFVTFTGKVIDLGDMATSCPIRPTFVSPSEFVAFGCHGSEESIQLAGFNLRGDFLWQTSFPDSQAYPSIVSAIPAGRFALSRTTTLSNVFGSEIPSASQLTGQEVRVMQTYNGRQLLRVTTSPIQLAGQNFTLSPDGMSLAVIHTLTTVHGRDTTRSTGVEIYALPPLSAGDQSQLNAEAALAPAHTNAKMRFFTSEIKSALRTPPAESTPAPADIITSASSPATPAAQSSPAQSSPAQSSPAQSSPAARPAMADSTSAPIGSIPASDPSPGCADLSGTSGTSPALACKVSPVPAHAADAASQPVAVPNPNPNPDAPRRKPPTLYEPAPAAPRQ